VKECETFSQVDGPIGLYVHVPFCGSKCHYCDFASWVDKGGQEALWISTLEQELSLRRRQLGNRPLDTIFIGGGTPSVLAPSTLERLCRAIAAFPRTPACEWSCEGNPGSLDREKLAILKAHGVDRISLGVQSLDETLLKRMGRAHDATQALEACELAESSGLRWNADLIFAVPGQTLDSFLESLASLVRHGARHISFYGLTIEAGTEFSKAVQAGKLAEVDEDEYARMYLEGAQYLEAEGILRYEVSNFACPGEECRHNQGYWRRDGAWLAAGNAAHGYLPWKRWSAPRGLEAWLQWGSAGFPVTGTSVEVLAPPERYTESWFLGLRTREGVDLSLLREEFGPRLDEARLKRWLDSGTLVRNGDTVRLQGEGWLLLDTVAADCSM